MSTPFIDVSDEFPEVDQFYVGNPDPGYYYCWANKKPENVERRKLEGYEVVSNKDREKGENALTPPNVMGERVMGDLILMRMPRERYERIERAKRAKTANQLSAANEGAREAIERSGFEVDDSTKITKQQGFPGGE